MDPKDKEKQAIEEEIKRLKQLIKEGKVPGVKLLKVNRAYSSKAAEESEGPAPSSGAPTTGGGGSG